MILAAADRRRNHSITQSIGGAYSLMEVWPAAGLFDGRKGDLFLFCTDGLTDAVPDELINRVLAHSKSSLEAVKTLVQVAEENGAPDNISLVLLQI